MPRTRKSHPPSLKAKVAVEAIKVHKTTVQISRNPIAASRRLSKFGCSRNQFGLQFSLQGNPTEM
jgi:hypothetical protein